MNLTEKIAYLEKKMDSNKFDIEYYGKKETLALLEISILNDNFKARTLNEKREDLSDLNIKDESQIASLIEEAERQLAYHKERLAEAYLNYNMVETYLLYIQNRLNH